MDTAIDSPAPALNVLLVEDSKVVTDRLVEALHHVEGTQLIGCVDTESGAVTALAHQLVDVLILDLHLKQGTGFRVMRAILKSPKKPQIIVLTNYDLPKYKKAARDLGANHVLDKVRDYAQVPQLLRELRNTPHARA